MSVEREELIELAGPEPIEGGISSVGRILRFEAGLRGRFLASYSDGANEYDPVLLSLQFYTHPPGEAPVVTLLEEAAEFAWGDGQADGDEFRPTPEGSLEEGIDPFSVGQNLANVELAAAFQLPAGHHFGVRTVATYPNETTVEYDTFGRIRFLGAASVIG